VGVIGDDGVIVGSVIPTESQFKQGYSVLFPTLFCFRSGEQEFPSCFLAAVSASSDEAGPFLAMPYVNLPPV
jgi:hypothetical protein